MTAMQAKSRRLARLLGVRQVALRAGETRLAAAGLRVETAGQRLGQVRGLIEASGTPPGETALSALRGAASLRALLGPVLASAIGQAEEAERARKSAALALAAATARHGRAERDFAAARAAAERQAEEMESAERVPPLKRKAP
ncbi:hypothetical protein L6Q21_13310 [Sandaracinobacter sp. RS1-74]|uniref:hypothetical protein n=1 Tax=Sandaracinobacteroides sayramensis TaxID=2913411 RepID=UPI001EDA0477|nr:hypothetical protein [Sandaracinobacteroides sayramensis]MCG2841961.1 hypothetical protein [Sandaracinobacteroides sayramensis]